MSLHGRLERIERQRGNPATDVWFLSPSSGRLIHVAPGGAVEDNDEDFRRRHPDARIITFSLREADGRPPVEVTLREWDG